MVEQLANEVTVQLDAAITDSATSFDVKAGQGASLPATASGDFRARVGTELMLVTDVTTDTLTVTRGVESTAAVAHEADDDLTVRPTAAGMAAWHASFGDADWTALSLVNSWANFGGGFAEAEYRRLPSGLVTVKGVIASGSTATVCANLPSGYRPADTLLFVTMANGVIGRVDVRADGDIYVSDGSGTWTALQPIVFYPDGS